MSDDRKFTIEILPSQRPNIEREEKVGDCFKTTNIGGDHYYLVREQDILHVADECINTLYDNLITYGRHNRGEKYIPIKRTEFNEKLNEQIFALNIFAKEFKSV